MNNVKITGNLEVSGQISGNGVKKLIDIIYPVGISLEFKLDVNPNMIWPWQTWVEWGQGCVVIGAGTYTDKNGHTGTWNLNTVGGEYNHTITVDEMPAHGHSIRTNTGNFRVGYGYGNAGYARINSFTEGTDIGAEIRADTSGSGSFHNNIQPYVVCKRWTRTK